MSGKRWGFFERFDIDDVSNPGVIYLTRWYLVKTPWFGIYLHAIRKPDHDRCLHDHPWNFIPIILWGSYLEELPDDQFVVRSAGSVRHMRAEDAHRIDDLSGKVVWTLCLVGRKRRDWGFHTTQGWKQWQEYLYE